MALPWWHTGLKVAKLTRNIRHYFRIKGPFCKWHWIKNDAKNLPNFRLKLAKLVAYLAAFSHVGLGDAKLHLTIISKLNFSTNTSNEQREKLENFNFVLRRHKSWDVLLLPETWAPSSERVAFISWAYPESRQSCPWLYRARLDFALQSSSTGYEMMLTSRDDSNQSKVIHEFLRNTRRIRNFVRKYVETHTAIMRVMDARYFFAELLKNSEEPSFRITLQLHEESVWMIFLMRSSLRLNNNQEHNSSM